MNLRSKMWKIWREYQYLRWLAYVASVLVPVLSLAGVWLWRRAADLAASAPEFSGGDETWATLSKAAEGSGLPRAEAAVPTGGAMVWLVVAPVLVVLLLCVLLWPQPKPKVPKDGKGPRRFPEEEAAKAKRACHGRCQHRSLLGLGPRCKERPCKLLHVFPWAKGGPSTADNAMAVCRRHAKAGERRLNWIEAVRIRRDGRLRTMRKTTKSQTEGASDGGSDKRRH